MIVIKGITIDKIFKWSWHHITWLLLLMGGIAGLYYFNIIQFSIPWLPVSVVGTAVAFYVGFKNNQAYDRMWEARKIWGGIVNDSRTWGMFVDNDLFTEKKASDKEVYTIKKRYIAWLYAHRNQLLVSTPWEHINQGGGVGRLAKRYQEKFGIGLVDDEVTRTELKLFLPHLKEIREQGLIDDFRYMENERRFTKIIHCKVKTNELKNFHYHVNMLI